MRVVLVIQARMSSGRLPGKVLADIAGLPMLARVIRRSRAIAGVEEVVVASTSRAADDPVARLSAAEDVRCIRGDEDDVLGRFVAAAEATKAEAVVRVTADCPLLDPVESGKVVRGLVEKVKSVDYASNVIERSYPRGLDTEALFRDVLERVARLGRSPQAREHVTWLINRERPDLFVRHSVRDAADNSDLRWTVDTAADLEMVRALYAGLGLGDRTAPYGDVLAYVRGHPALAALNAGQTQKDA